MRRLGISRRDFIKQSAFALGVCAAGLAPLACTPPGIVPSRALGRTDRPVSILGLSATNLTGMDDERQAVRLIHEAAELSETTIIDLASNVEDRATEKLVGRAIKGNYRERVFLTVGIKCFGREACRHHLEEQLRRLQVETIDLWVLDERIYERGPDAILGSNGVLEVAIEARRRGLIRFIGLSGYRNADFLKFMLTHYFDIAAVHIPIMGIDGYYKTFQEKVLPALRVRNIGTIAAHPVVGGRTELDFMPPERVFNLLWSQLITSIAVGVDSSETLHRYAETARRFKTMPEEKIKSLLDELEKSRSGRLPFRVMG